MIAMAQHHCQQLHNSQQASHCQQPASSATNNHIQTQQPKDITATTVSTKASSTNASNMQQQSTTNQEQEQHQDGKRTLIKNQLYLIEQLQLENANLRNERDQLQFENEELKFQLQMISSSNILSQPGGNAFKEQNLERLVGQPSNGKAIINELNQANGAKAILRDSTASSVGAINSRSSCSTPLRLFPRLVDRANNNNQNQRQSVTLVRAGDVGDKLRPTSLIDQQSSISATAASNKLLAGKSTSLTAFNVKSVANSATGQATDGSSRARELPQDEAEEEQQVKKVEQLYGDSELVQAAAIIIQRAFRKYQICKRFRTITEQLRHTYQSSSANSSSSNNNNTVTKQTQCPENPLSNNTLSSTITSNSGNQQQVINKQADPTYAWGTTRAAAWESLSQAASRLAASATAAKNTANGVSKSPTSVGQQVVDKQQQANGRQNPSASENQKQVSGKQDPVVTAAINFQQLESIRKRQYRVGLNIFNKNPEKGVSFLVAHSFIDSSPPYTKTSTYYPSNQLHFIDKQQHFVQQQQQQVLTDIINPNNSNQQNCQMCFEEDNLKRNVAHFLLLRKGLAKEKIGQYLGNLQAQFNQDVLKYYLQELDFYGLQIDLALRKFLSTFRLPGEAQKIERIVDYFAQRYVQCQQQQQPLLTSLTNPGNLPANLSSQKPKQQQQTNQMMTSGKPTRLGANNSNNTLVGHKNNLILLTKDEIFILTFAIIMLNTDLHSPSLKPTSRMSATQFVNNLRGVFKSQIINESDLIEIYERVKANQITTTPDHVTHVMKVQQGLTVTNFQKKELPNLCVPHRRLVCFCRLFEVYDVNKKERIGQHQREIFLFNDLLLVTKLARRVRANTIQLYTYRQSIPLQGLSVQLFQSAHFNFGIRLYQRSSDETVIMFNARNELDQSRFVDDLSESIAEMDEMDTIRTNNIIETIYFRYSERLKRHSIMHSGNNETNVILQQSRSSNSVLASDDNQATSRKTSLINNCDIRITNNNRPMSVSASDCNNDNNEKIIITSDGGSNNSIATKPAPSSNICGDQRNHNQPIGRRTVAHHQTGKFSSMFDLSSTIANGKGSIIKDDELCGRSIESSSTKSSGLSQAFVRPASSDHQSGDGRVGDQQASFGSSGPAPPISAANRRGSTNSVHSLDSGLFLSRDVSPNQSS